MNGPAARGGGRGRPDASGGRLPCWSGRALAAALTALLPLAAACAGEERPRGAGAPELVRLFRVDSLQAPESVAWDSARGRYLITNTAGGEEGGGGGFVSSVSRDGDRTVRRAYGAGAGTVRLDQPRGIAVRGDTAWIADGRHLVALDLAGDSALYRLRAEGGELLNDVAIARDGTVYVSDTGADQVYRLVAGPGFRPAGAPGSLRGPNGLLAEGPRDPLLIAGWDGALLALNPDSSVTLLAEAPELQRLDGIQRSPAGDLLVTDYAAGRLQHLEPRSDRVWRTGTVWLEGLEGPADFLVHGRVLALPEHAADRVTFYRIGRESSG